MLHELGRGGMGVVWLAREKSLDRLVALKLIAVADPRLQQRLLREGQAAARLRHPNIVAVHAMGGTGQSTFLAMEFIEGGNLDANLQGKPLAPRKAAEIASKIASALAHAHEAGLLHRDIKPSNILMDLDGEPRLADFGIAAPLEGAGDLTAPGTIAGSPAFLAPELLGGAEQARPQSDIYGLGAVLYNCLTGRPPFVGASAAAILAQLPDKDPLAPHLLQPGLPRDIETICLKCLERSPGKRYATALLLKADLDAFLRGEPISARPVGPLERSVRYCRRHPGLTLSTALASVFLLALAIGGPLMAIQLSRSERKAVAARIRAEQAEASTLERLRESLLARSRATRLSGGRGQRDDALAAATDAAHIRKGLDARDEVIAALARPEIVQLCEFKVSRSGEGRISFEPDGDRYAIETPKGGLEIRRLSDDGLLRALRLTQSKIWSDPVFSPDGRWLAVRNADAQELVWRTDQTDPAFVLSNRPYVLTGRYPGYGCPEAFSPDGLVLASALAQGGVSFHSTSDGSELRRTPTDLVITHVAYSPDGRWLAIGRGLRSGAKPAFLRVVGASTGLTVCALPVDASYQTIAWSKEGDRLVTGGEELNVYQVPTGARVLRIADPLALKAFFGPGGTTVLSSATSGLGTLWDMGRARPMLTADLGSDPPIAVSRDGTLIAKTLGTDAVRLYRIEMSKVVRSLPVASGVERDSVVSLAVPVIDYSPDGRWLATAVWGAVQLRDSSGSVVSVTRLGSSTNRCSLRFARDGGSLLAASSELGLVRLPILFPIAGSPKLGPPEAIDPEPAFFITDVSPDGSRAILTSFESGLVKIVNLSSKAQAAHWSLPGAAGAAFVNGDTAVIANSVESNNGAPIEIHDAATGKLLRTVDYPNGAHVHVSADGSWALVGSGSEHTYLLKTADWSPGPALPTEVQGRGTQPAIAPDNRLIAFGCGDMVELVSAADGSVLAHLQSPQSGTYLPGLTFSPDGATLALWWENGQLTLWDLRRLRGELATRGLDW